MGRSRHSTGGRMVSTTVKRPEKLLSILKQERRDARQRGLLHCDRLLTAEIRKIENLYPATAGWRG